MSESKDADDMKLGAAKRPLGLKKTAGAGQVRQSFSHGRSKAVVVEHKVKRKLTLATPASAPIAPAPKADIKAPATAATPAITAPIIVTPAAPPVTVAPEVVAEQPVKKAAAAVVKIAPRPNAQPAPITETTERKARPRAEKGRQVLRTLTVEEHAAREKALTEARAMALEQARKLEIEARRLAEIEALKPPAPEVETEETPSVSKPTEPDLGIIVLSEEELAERARAAERRKKETPKIEVVEEEEEADDDVKGARAKRKLSVAKAPPRARDEPRRRAGRLTIQVALDDDLGERQRSLASIRRARERERYAAKAGSRGAMIVREVIIPEAITVTDLANRMAVRVNEVIRILRAMDEPALPETMLDPATAQIVVEELGHTAKLVAESDVEIGLDFGADASHELQPRPPVVTVMGHVDHGKTSLLDALRKTDVVAGEKGGITQHIGAYQVETASGQKITFIDTPGHEAFTAMRARGAGVTDIVVLVVAADDGVKPQTVEAIHHAKAAGAPVIVAINKMDKPQADPTRVRQELLQHEIFVEEMGGDVLTVEVSAVKGTNLDKLIDAILLQAELMDLRANPNRPANGIVIEARLDKGRGPVATMLIKGGTLRRGDIVVAGAESGRVRALADERGGSLNEAGPSTPVEVLGLQSVPQAGEDVIVVSSEARAREVSEFRQRRQTAERTTSAPAGSLEDMFAQLKRNEIKELPVVLKADVQGSLEAIQASLEKLSTSEVRVRILLGGVGAITESDVSLAQASRAPVFGFNVRANPQAKLEAEKSRVEIRYYGIIYDLIDDIKRTMSGMLAPERRETMLGNARVLEVFKVSKMGKAAGGLVTDGVVRRGAGVRVIRDNVVLHDGALSSLRRFKDEVREVQAGTECGMAFENFQDLRVGDVIECFEVEHIARTL